LDEFWREFATTLADKSSETLSLQSISSEFSAEPEKSESLTQFITIKGVATTETIKEEVMSQPRFLAAAYILIAMASLTSTGCLGYVGPSLGLLSIPIPVSPYFQDQKELEYWNHERYSRAPILGPLTAGGPAIALDPPSDDEVMQAFEKARPIRGGLPMLYETQRNNVRIVKEKIADYIDPPRVVPLIGPVQLHHAHYKCTIYYSELVRVGWPVPHTLTDEEAAEVVYIDHNHFHMVGNVNTGSSSQFYRAYNSRHQRWELPTFFS
jgi:hypothetical protein